MLRKVIKFTDFDGREVEEEFFFHLTKAELLKLQYTMPGGFAENLDRIGRLNPQEGNNAGLILQTFEDIVKAAFGKKLENGRYAKRLEDWEEFVATDAYSNLLLELVGDANYAAQFVKGIMPADMDLTELQQVDTAAKALEQGVQDVELPSEADPEILPVWYRERREPTQAELVEMDKNEMLLAFKVKTQGFPDDLPA